jgi:heparosan-N-sulfate-glucuronate 5-epimerase
MNDQGYPVTVLRGRARGRLRAVRIFSTAMWFPQEMGSHFVTGSVRGYYIDLSDAAKEPEWPPPWLHERRLHVGVCQWGLGSYERYVAGDGTEWLDAAIAAADYLVGKQEQGGRFEGGWVHRFPYPNTYRLPAPWLSGIAQGQGASLLVRLHLETGDPRYRLAACKALRPLSVPTAEGGVLARLDGGGFPEEFPTDPPSFVLNGGIYALWGYYDTWLGLGDEDAGERFRGGVETLARNLHRWDAGFWSRYDLYPHPVVHIASPWYHTFHIAQLKALDRIAPRPEFRETAERFESYASARLNRIRAFAHKALFRALVPRTGTRARWRAPRS